jgi:VHL beta domain
MSHVDAVRRTHLVRRSAALIALVVVAFGVASMAHAATPPPVPDAQCANESTFKSLNSDHSATLHVINNTDQPLQLLWLDFKGNRVFYQQVPPLATIDQRTFLTHPWIVADQRGNCVRILVMTSLDQSVQVDPGPGAPVATAPTFSSSTTTPSSSSSVNSGAAPPRPSTAKSSSSSPVLPIALSAGAIAAIAAALAWWRRART